MLMENAQIKTNIMTDSTPMPFGKYRGVLMANVPSDYLIWIYENMEGLFPDLRSYIENNMDALELESQRNKKA